MKTKSKSSLIEIVLSRNFVVWETLFFLFCSLHLNAQVTIVEKNNVLFSGKENIYTSQKNCIDNVAPQELSSKKESIIIYDDNVVISGQDNFYYVNDCIIKDKPSSELNKNTINLLSKNNNSEKLKYLTKHNSPKNNFVDFNDKSSSSYFLIFAPQSYYLLPNKYENKFGLLNPLYKKQQIIDSYSFLLTNYHKKRFQDISNRLLCVRPPPVLLG